MNQYRTLSIQTSTPSPSMHPKLTAHDEYYMQNNQLLTITPVELTDNYNVLIKFNKMISYFDGRLC